MDRVDSKVCMYKHPEYIFYEDRLNSYALWSDQIIPKKELLARAGFWYTKEGDKVTCFSCGISLLQWKPPDQPWIEHANYSNECAYLKMCGQTAKSGCEFGVITNKSNPIQSRKNLFGMNYYAEQTPAGLARDVFNAS